MTSMQKAIKFFAVGLAICIIVGIISGALGLIFAVTGIEGENLKFSFNSEARQQEQLVSKIEYFQDITSLEINSDYASLQIQEGDEYSVEFINISDRAVLEKRGNGTLVVDASYEENWWLESLFSGSSWYQSEDSTVVVTLKKDAVLDSVLLNTGSGKNVIENFKTDQMEIDIGSGSFFASNIQANDCLIDSGSGSISFEQSEIGDLDLNTGSGRFYYGGSLGKNIHIDGGSGSITFDLLGVYEEYNFEVDTGSGGVRVNEHSFEDGLYGEKDADKKMWIDGDSGRIVIDIRRHS